MVIYSLSLSVLNELAENGTKYMGEVCSDILFHVVKQYLEWFINAKGTVILIIGKEVELSLALMYYLIEQNLICAFYKSGMLLCYCVLNLKWKVFMMSF